MAEYHSWTPGAKHCYEIGGVCQLCHIPKMGLDYIGYSIPCQMHIAVEYLLKKLGPPPSNFSHAGGGRSLYKITKPKQK